MLTMNRTQLAVASIVVATAAVTLARQDRLVHADLAYRAPGTGPAPNFSPYGTQVPLTDLAAGTLLPPGAVRPAKTGTIHVGPTEQSWIRVLVTADANHPADLCRLYLDRNRNGDFADDGPALTATPTQNEKTKAWWSSFAKTEFSIPYGRGPQAEIVEPYSASFWLVREGEAPPEVVRYSVASWRSGTVTVDGVDALVAVMDANNDAIFDKRDMWSVLAATEPDAAKRVLSIAEARPTSRLMFLETGTKQLVLEFRGMSPDGRSIDFAVVDRPVTKAADRAPDDMLAPERSRPRTTAPFTWRHGDLDAALTEAKRSGRKVLLDFEATWCGPCKHMDEWIWNDADVAALLNAGYVGVKLDGDVEKALVKRFAVQGYPIGIVLDSSAQEIRRFVGYQTSKEILAFLTQTKAPAQTPAQPDGVTVTIDRNIGPAATRDFKFAHVPSPAKNDAGARAQVRLVDGQLDPNGAGLSALTDGLWPTSEDEPEANCFFDAGTAGGAFRLDLGSAVDIAQVNTYSWHPNTRGPQVYWLYASDGTDPKFNPTPGATVDAATAGWTLIATVDTRPRQGDPGGQYGVSITRPNGSLGRYRYLLFVCFATEADDDYGNTFYSEIDVVLHAHPAPRVSRG
jgi:thiol-disulfide isomerase/thioredoxin